MKRYRCFCMTKHSRIITGAMVEAGHVAGALELVSRKWSSISSFALVEIWLGPDCVHPASPRIFADATAGTSSRSVGLPDLSGQEHDDTAWTLVGMLEREMVADGGQASMHGIPAIAAQAAD